MFNYEIRANQFIAKTMFLSFDEFQNAIEALRNEIRRDFDCEEKLITLNTLNRRFSDYRRIILNSELSIEKKSYFKEEFKLNEDETKERFDNNQSALAEKKSNVAVFTGDKDEYIQLAEKLLTEKNMMHRLIGLCALTGRRESEIALSASFEKIDDFHVMFSGQMKTPDINKKYPIPLLSTSDLIIDALAEFRKRKDYTKGYNPFSIEATRKFNASYSKDIRIAMQKFFISFYDSKQAKAHDLRAIYANLTYLDFNDSKILIDFMKNEMKITNSLKAMDKELFIKRVLGHVSFQATMPYTSFNISSQND